jgi:hypothetical protein
MMQLQELRVLEADYGEVANQRVRELLGFTGADFRALRRAYDDPRRSASKRATLEVIRRACEAEGAPLYPGDER